ncbi:hypothetical protein FRC04_006696 [Tulasnella sp. 424]|nr:hypothetical protein FRC04_006696 [Tulasnella sp. 424]KAG8966733.1 hypothetical protein FRC05_002446 [Tulasnella sp. 425]
MAFKALGANTVRSWSGGKDPRQNIRVYPSDTPHVLRLGTPPDVPDCDVNLNITESKTRKNQLQVGSPEDNNAPGVVIWFKLCGAVATPVSISAMFSLSLVNQPKSLEENLQESILRVNASSVWELVESAIIGLGGCIGRG